MVDSSPDVVIFSLSKYDDPISSVGFSYAKEFAKNHRVFFIEQPITWKDYVAHKGQPYLEKRKPIWHRGGKYLQDPSIPANITYIVPPRMLPVNFLPEGFLYDKLSAYNDRLMFRLLEEVLREHKVERWVYYNVFHPFYMNRFPAHIKPIYKAYLSLDDMSQVSYTARHGIRREGDIISNWEISFATGREIQKNKQQYNPRTHYLPNASDISIFRKAYEEKLEKPAELKDLEGRKIIGFTGSVEYRTDFVLLKKMVEAHQDKMFVVVGPVYAEEVKQMGFEQMANVRFCGPKKITELPAYLQHMDVMIIPFALTILTKSIYPLKINEYLGAGKPVVATHFSEDIFSFRDVVYIAESHDEFIALIDKAIAEDDAGRRRARVEKASQNTWAHRVEHFWNCAREEGLI